MTIEEILTNDDVVSSINENIRYLVKEIPEIRSMFNFEQSHPHHHLDVWEHTLLALSFSKNDFKIRMSLLLHDIGKPFSYQDEEVRHFHGHAEVSAKMAYEILTRLGYDENFIKEVVYLIRTHDTRITREEIIEHPIISKKRLHIQECDSLAHHPDYQEKRLAYIEEMKELIQEVTMDKQTIRDKYKKIRKEIPNKEEKSEEIFNAIINDPLYQEANVIAFYNSMKGEVDTHKLMEYSKQVGKTVLLPRVLGFDLIFFKITEETKYQTSGIGISEPIGGYVYSPEKIDLVIVPGLAFDKEGNRIGYGGGYYDRYLEFSKLPSIALCYQDQIIDEELPVEEYDMKVDIIQTEKNRYFSNNYLKKRKQKES